jgi:general stress protein 26
MPGTPSKPIDQVKREVMEWLQTKAGFAQVYTINKDGFPTGRTMGAPVNDDWSVDLIQGNQGYDRVNQVRQNPKLEILWIDTRSDQVVPKAVFLRGVGEVYEGDRVIEEYDRRWALNQQRGRARGEKRPADEVRRTLIGIKVRPERIRVEGFGEGSEVFIWKP